VKAEYHNTNADVNGSVILQSAQDTGCHIVDWIYMA